jgi:hypothetical protein
VTSILTLDVTTDGHAALSGIAADRIRSFTERYDETVNPRDMVSMVMSHVWQGDPNTLVLLLVDETKGIVGHLLGEYRPRDRLYLTIQAEADAHSGGAMKDALAEAEAWGRAQGARRAIYVTHHDPKVAQRWCPDYEVARTIMMRDLEPTEETKP